MFRCVMVYKLSITLKTLSEIAEKETGQKLVINRAMTEVVTIDTPEIPNEKKIEKIGKTLIATKNRKNTELVAVDATFIGYRSVRPI